MALTVSSNTFTQSAYSISAEDVPNELWSIVVSYLAAGSDFRGLSAMVFTSKRFLNICLNTLKMPIAFVGIPFIEKCSFGKLKMKKCPVEHYGTQRLLTVDEQGRQYCCSQHSNFTGHILKIMDPALMQVITLNLKDEISKKGGEIASFSEGQRIVNCHPIPEGFIVVCAAGCSVWKWDEKGKPYLIRFNSPFKVYTKDVTEIRYSACENNWLFIQSPFDRGVEVLDLKDLQSNFSKVEVSEEIPIDSYCLYQIEGKPGLINASNFLTFTYIQNENSYIVKAVGKPTIVYGDQAISPCSSPHWTLSFLRMYRESKKDSRLFVSQKGALWMGAEYNLRMPMEDSNELYFIYKDFLFLSYQDGAFRLIHLPTKSTCSCSNNQALQQFLAANKIILHWISIDTTIPGQPVLKLLGVPLSGEYESFLYQWEISFYLEPNSPIDDAKEIFPLTLSKKVEELGSNERRSCFSNQITIIVSIVLLILAWAGASIALIVLHPGTVIYEGSGVILTLPAVLSLSIGGFVVLMSIAIGSYLWWKEKSALAPARTVL